MQKLLVLLYVLYSSTSFSQSNPEVEVFNSLIYNYLGSKDTRFYIECNKSRTFFDASDFSQNVNQEVSRNILEQLEIASKKDTIDNKWDAQVFNILHLPSDWLILNYCQTKQDIERIFEVTKKRQKFYRISKPVFDEKEEHCVLHISVLWWPGSASGESLFLKKVYGNWVVIEKYDMWIN